MKLKYKFYYIDEDGKEVYISTIIINKEDYKKLYDKSDEYYEKYDADSIEFILVEIIGE